MNLNKNWHKLTKKIIGVTGSSRFSWHIQQLIENYYGARPLYFIWNKKDDLRYFLETVDAMIYAGGTDILPSWYGKKVEEKDLYKYAPERDMRESFMIKWCNAHKIPQLCICRSFQLISCMEGLGGDFEDELKYRPVDHAPFKTWEKNIWGEVDAKHPIDILPEYKNQFPDKVDVLSFHHQGVKYCPNKDYQSMGIEIIGTAPIRYPSKWMNGENIIELMRIKRNNQLLCQLHPELQYKDNPLCKRIVQEFKEMIT